MVDAWGWGQGEETWNEFCHQKTRSWAEPGWALTIWLQVGMVWKPDPLKDIISALNESRSCGECNNFFALGIYREPLSISQAYTSVGFYRSDSAQIFSLPPFPARWVSSSVSKAILRCHLFCEAFSHPHKQLPQPGSQFLAPASGRAMPWALQGMAVSSALLWHNAGNTVMHWSCPLPALTI